jgi:hypothetical protein
MLSTPPPPSGSSTGSATAPSGLTAWMLDVLEDFNLDEGFRWDVELIMFIVNLTNPLSFTLHAVQSQCAMSRM